jgi:hypothetical protein
MRLTGSRAARVVLVLLAAVVFGAVDQWIGGRYSPLLTAVSGMSAPWLLLPFLVGACQQERRPAAVLGLAASWLAVGAYVLMIISPMEGARFTGSAVASTTASQWMWFTGGLLSGPVYGLLGHYWRARRSWAAALVATLPLVLEPGARWLAGHFGVLSWSSFAPAVYAEVAAGLALSVAVGVALVLAWRRGAQAGEAGRAA